MTKVFEKTEVTKETTKMEQTTEKTVPGIPTMSPKQVAEYGIAKYEINPMLRLLNAAHWASLHAAGKPHFRPKHVVVRIVGPSGVGKTALVEDYCRTENIGYVKLDSQITDIAELFGLSTTQDNAETGKKETVVALPNWWPKEGTRGIINVDDMCRALPHILQALQQFIMERKFNGVELPETWSIVITDNPDDGEHHVSALDKAQISRMISIAYNPSIEVEFEQLVRQEVDEDCKNFWMTNTDLVKLEKIEVDKPHVNPRMRFIWNRIYPYIKHDPGLFDLVGSNMFGVEFVASFKAFVRSEQPISPIDILNKTAYEDKLTKWEKQGRNDLISLTVKRLVLELKNMDSINKDQWEAVSKFLKLVPIEAGSVAVRQMVASGTPFGTRMMMFLIKDKELTVRYREYMKGVDAQLA